MPFILVPFVTRRRRDHTNGNAANTPSDSRNGHPRKNFAARRLGLKSRRPTRMASASRLQESHPTTNADEQNQDAHTSVAANSHERAAAAQNQGRTFTNYAQAENGDQRQPARRLGGARRKRVSSRDMKLSIKGAIANLFRPIKSLLRFIRPNITISFKELDASGAEIVVAQPTKLYTTYDEIRGTITIQSRSNCRFDNVEIALTGVTKTFVDKLSNTSAVSGRSEAIHRFLKLVQPINDSDLPVDKLLVAKKQYTIPFTFVVPSTLMPRACMHAVVGPHIKDLHTMLPPSLAEKGNQDGGSEQSKISYKIIANVTRKKHAKKAKKLCEVVRRIRIRPANEEMPPLAVDGNDTYCLRSEKTIRDGLLKGRSGTLIVEAIQPKAFHLKPPGVEEAVQTSFVRLHLRYDPDSDGAIPPKLNYVGTKIKVTTHFATTARKDFPRKEVTDLTCDTLTDVHTLANYSVALVDWRRHTLSEGQSNSSVLSFRRDSSSNFFASSTSITSGDSELPIKPSTTYRDGSQFYTAQITVPVSLPNLPNKQFLPTFHTCLVSRVYVLQLALSLSGSPLAQPLRLIVPVQVASESTAAGAERQRLAEIAEQAMIEAAIAFEPRFTGSGLQISDGQGMIVAARNPTRRDGNNEMPPDYEQARQAAATS